MVRTRSTSVKKAEDTHSEDVLYYFFSFFSDWRVIQGDSDRTAERSPTGISFTFPFIADPVLW